jgi:hypothetical protein
MVLGGIWLAMIHPAIFLAGLFLFLLLAAWLIHRLATFARQLIGSASRPLAGLQGNSTG